MKRKYAALLLSGALGLSLCSGCGNAEPREKLETLAAVEEDAVYGEVSQMSKDAITIKVGTRRRMEKPEGELPDRADEDALTDEKGKKMPQGQPGEMPSMLDLTGEEQEIQVTEETAFQRQNMRGGPGGMAGNHEPSEQSGEEISSSDIVQGDVIMVTFTEDGSAEMVTVISQMGAGGDMRDYDRRENDGSMTDDVLDTKEQGNEMI